jgi:RHS repeat-associated protein
MRAIIRETKVQAMPFTRRLAIGVAALVVATPSVANSAAQGTYSPSQSSAVGVFSNDSLNALVSSASSSGDNSSSGTSAEASDPAGGVALPTPDTGSTVGGQSVSLPSGAGTSLGMGESFSAQLTTGLATYSIPIGLPKARGSVQPNLMLSYSSSSGPGIAGIGWNVGVSSISRKTDHGMPGFDDEGHQGQWHANQDRFTFGADELVPICVVTGASCSGALNGEVGEVMPQWAEGWQYFRARIEAGFLRFFWSSDHRTWIVQAKDGSSLEFGVPLDGSGYTGGLESNPTRSKEIARWHIVRQYDAHRDVQGMGATTPVNVVVYRYITDGGIAYLSDIYDTPPAANPGRADLTAYAHHARLNYEERPDKLVSFRSGWRTDYRMRLTGIDVTSMPFDSPSAARELVRRYHLTYDSTSHASILTSFQSEGRCSYAVAESYLAESACPRLSPLKFEYQKVSSTLAPVTDVAGRAYEPFSTTLKSLSASPPHSLGQMETALMDINGDSLPDVLVTSGALYGGKHGLFLNGASGKLGFTNNQGMQILGDSTIDAGVLKLSNSNVSAIDLDADGRINLVYMPRGESKYSVFSPTCSTSGWAWQASSVSSTAGQSVKIDWTGNAKHTRVMDVNGDGLVDVVYASATEIQTFFALGRFPGGQGQFGHAKRLSATQADVSTDPVTACMPWSATPVRFGDPDVYVAEMNGDGLPDIVRVRPGQVLYWPGRGNGTWGTGERDDCAAGSFGTDRSIQVENSPYLEPLETSTFLISDVTGDGLADLVKIRNNAVDIYVNENGLRLTDRATLENTPVHPNGSNRVALIDINGSGTPDLLWGEANNYQYIDLTGGIQPLLLKKVHNGLGATTELQYSTSTQLMLDAATGGKPWASQMPLATPVVVKSIVRDNLDKVGRTAGVVTTEYRYRDPVFDGKARDFVGFRNTEVWSYGDSNSPTSIQKSEYLMGDMSVSNDDEASRWRDALKGLPVIEEQADTNGVYLSTKHTGYEIKWLYKGLDGRYVWHRNKSTIDVFAYDTDQFVAATDTASITDYSISGPTDSPSASRAVNVRATVGTARLRSSLSSNDFGNATKSEKEGCVEGCPAGVDETISVISSFARPDGDTSGWLWREVESYVKGSQNTASRNRKQTTYTSYGDPVDTILTLVDTLPLDRFHSSGGNVAPTPASASYGITQPAMITSAHREYDEFGNAVDVRGPNGQCSSIVPDPPYAQLVVETTSYAGALAADGCGERAFTSTFTYDRGLGLPVQVVAPQGQPAENEYDGFGRVLAKYGPDPNSPLTLNTQARQKFIYTVTPDPIAQPYSVLRTQTLDQDAAGAFSYIEDWAFVDGLGRSIFTLGEADPSAGDAGQYVVNGDVAYNQKGKPYLAHEPTFWSGSPDTFSLATQLATATKSQNFDTFGRIKQSVLQDGKVKAEVHYHALTVDTWDAGDLDATSVYAGTYTTKTSDGHGRTPLVTNRFKNGSTIEEHLTLAQFLPTGEVTQITQRRTGSSDYVRTFTYDSLGRMVQNAEPNTTAYDTGGNVSHAWRYAYDDAGRLVGTSNAMGCGANYFYDAGGRLLGTDFSPCKPEQLPYSAPDLNTGDGLESFVRYDEADPNATSVVDATGKALSVSASNLWGRVASSYTRGDFEVYAYDGLGRAVGTGKRLARPGASDPRVANRYAPRWYVNDASYDAVDRKVRVSTGAPVLAQLSPDGSSDLRTSYTRRGLVRTVDSSYGLLVAGEVRDARGLLQSVTYGDAAQTSRTYKYNDLTQVTDVQTSRASAALWSAQQGSGPYVPPPISGQNTTQLLLEDYTFKYDVAGNLTEAQDWRTAEEWGDTVKPVNRTFEYDSYSRLTKTTYAYAGGNTWQSPYDVENTTSTRVPQPSPQVSFSTRVGEETFSYDWLNNLVDNKDDSNGFYDRSTGTSNYGQATAPHRLTAASNRSTGSARTGEAAVAYDDAGQVTGMIVQRDGACLPNGASCWQRFAYEWDEIGNLQRARRWDLTSAERTPNGTLASALPSRTPDAELKYSYAGTSRVLKTATTTAGDKQTVYVFATLELRSTTYSGTGMAADYALSTDTTQLRLGAGSVAARLVIDANMPHTTASTQHLLMEFGDRLGSPSFTIDHDTGELVQYTTYTSYGTGESDYRPTRWSSFREPYRFTGKEDDMEVGLSYHGARYYSPALHRWMSPDPVTIHSAGSDRNPYGYGYGNPTSYVDPDGRNPIIAALVGAVVGTIVSTVTYMLSTPYEQWTWKGGLTAAATGAAAGFVAGMTGAFAQGAFAHLFASETANTIVSGFAGSVTAGTVGGLGSYATGSILAGQPMTSEGAAHAMECGMVSGALGGAIGAAAIGLNYLSGGLGSDPWNYEFDTRTAGDKLTEGTAVSLAQGVLAYGFMEAVGAKEELAEAAAVSGALNGAISGYRGIYNWNSITGYAAAILDATWGLTGTTLGHLQNLWQWAWGGQYQEFYSFRQNREVYLDGYNIFGKKYALTLGHTVGNWNGDNMSLLNDHESLHIWQSRLFGPFYEVGTIVWKAAYPVGWVTGGGIQGGDYAGYVGSPFEWQAYREQIGYEFKSSTEYLLWDYGQ